MRAIFYDHLGDFGDFVNIVGRINARLERLEEASSTVEQENKGESMATKDTKRDEQLKAYRAEASEREAPAGLRTERVVLEVTYFGDDSGPPAKWPWQDWVSRLDKGESVRVVSDEERGAEVAKLRSQNELQLKQIAEFASRSGDDLNVVRAERDAAIRELSAEKMWRDNLAMQRNEIRDERDALKARVASLEAASGNSTAQPYGSQAASGGGEGEPAGWCAEWKQDGKLGSLLYRSHPDAMRDIPIQCNAVPLYRAPPQPRGWLSEEEVWALRVAADNLPGMEDADGEPLDPLEGVFRNLLARSSPPEVVLPPTAARDKQGVPCVRLVEVRWALDAAGVAVKEVPRE
jgi:hypothetical protein